MEEGKDVEVITEGLHRTVIVLHDAIKKSWIAYEFN